VNATRTIQKEEVESHIRDWFQGSKGEQRFPVKGKPQGLFGGDYLFIIWRGSIYGRFKVKDIEEIAPGHRPVVGSRQFETKGTHNIVVEAPGEIALSVIQRKGHVGIRYDEVKEWA